MYYYLSKLLQGTNYDIKLMNWKDDFYIIIAHIGCDRIYGIGWRTWKVHEISTILEKSWFFFGVRRKFETVQFDLHLIRNFFKNKLWLLRFANVLCKVDRIMQFHQETSKENMYIVFLMHRKSLSRWSGKKMRFSPKNLYKSGNFEFKLQWPPCVFILTDYSLKKNYATNTTLLILLSVIFNSLRFMKIWNDVWKYFYDSK